MAAIPAIQTAGLMDITTMNIIATLQNIVFAHQDYIATDMDITGLAIFRIIIASITV